MIDRETAIEMLHEAQKNTVLEFGKLPYVLDVSVEVIQTLINRAIEYGKQQTQTTYREPALTVESNSQDWAGMDGAIAFQLIERHANNWSDIGKMMHEWLQANQLQMNRGCNIDSNTEIQSEEEILAFAQSVADKNRFKANNQDAWCEYIAMKITSLLEKNPKGENLQHDIAHLIKDRLMSLPHPAFGLDDSHSPVNASTTNATEDPLAKNNEGAIVAHSLSRADFRQAIAKAAIALKINRSITGQETVVVSGNLSLEQLFDFANEVARSERDRLVQSYQQWFASQGMSDVWAKATVEVMKRMEQS